MGKHVSPGSLSLFPYNSHRCHSVLTHVPRAPFIFLRPFSFRGSSSVFLPSFSLMHQRSSDSPILLIEVPPLRRLVFLFLQHVAPRPSFCYNVFPRRPYNNVALYSPFVPTSFSVPPSTTLSLSVSHPRGEGAIARPYRAYVTRERLISARAVLSSAWYRTVLAALASSSSIGVRRRKTPAVSSLRSSLPRYRAPRRSQPAVFFGFFLAPTVHLRRLSDTLSLSSQ